jgi:hypothetical protein
VKTPQAQAKDLMRMIVARHEGDGWQVFAELASGISAREPRRADAVAMGLWPSMGMEVHGYEIKISRGDARKELRDPAKQEPIGRYCDFWWLVVGSEEIIDGLLVPPTWGVLAPRNRVLRIVRKAPKRKAAPLDRRFVAAMLRSANKDRILRVKHDEAVEQLQRDLREVRDRTGTTDEVERLRDAIRNFENAAGIEIGGGWHGQKIGEAVKVVYDLLHGIDPHGLRRRSQSLQREASIYEEHAEDARKSARALDEVLDALHKMQSAAASTPVDPDPARA